MNKRCCIFFLTVFIVVGGFYNKLYANYSMDSSGTFIIAEITIEGNKITKAPVIFREITFHVNDSISTAELANQITQSRQNLLNSALFNFVTINYISLNPGQLIIEIKVTERWYIWPIPIFEIADRNLNIWLQTFSFKRINYGSDIVWNNFRGRRESLKLTLKFGYSEKYGLSYLKPNIGAKQRNGIGFGYAYSRNHEIGFKSLNNTLLFYNDSKKYTREEANFTARYTFRKGIFNIHTADVKYNQVWVSDTMQYLAPNYLLNGKNTLSFFSLTYIFVADHRDYKPYPLKGWVLAVDASQIGFGILKNETTSFFKLETGYRYHHQISNRFYGAYAAKIKWSSINNQPYYLQRGLGYGDYIRGYEYYVMDGHQYADIRTNFKYKLIKQTTVDFNVLKGEKFDKVHFAVYLNTYFDAGYVTDKLYAKENKLNNTLQYGYGIGLDIVTYYDRVFRIDYSLNKLGQSGFFFHYSAPI